MSRAVNQRGVSAPDLPDPALLNRHGPPTLSLPCITPIPLGSANLISPRRTLLCPRIASTVTFSWTAEGRLAGHTLGSTVVAHHYDVAGRVVRRDVNGSPERHFLWDGADLLAELGAVATTKVAEHPPTGSTGRTRWWWGTRRSTRTWMGSGT